MDDNDIVFNSYGPDVFASASDWFAAIRDGQGLSWLYTAWEVYSIIAFILSALFIIGIIYSYIRFNQLSEIEMNRLLADEREWQRRYGRDAGDNQWQNVQAHLASDNPNDWKLAIIEADVLLDRVLKEAGFAGNSVGERLKSASPTNFTTLQDAWDAHIIRNKIAHEGSDFIVTMRVAKEAITKYQRVFQEFGVV